MDIRLSLKVCPVCTLVWGIPGRPIWTLHANAAPLSCSREPMDVKDALSWATNRLQLP